MTNCQRKAITRTDHRCRIDESKWIGCSLCQKNCPSDAIVRRKIPYADECAMEALSKDAQGYSLINPEKCIHFGRCMTRCLFGCISMTSMIFDVARYLHQKDRPVIAMFAPAVFEQFPASPHQLRNACLKCGFSDMVEVSLGADTTSLTEAAEFLEHVGTGAQPVLMTSCCPAWVRAVRIHVPKLAPFLSNAGSPMKYKGDMLKARDPDCITVFVGACTAKRAESQIIENTDLVITAEEMLALFDACGVNPSAMPKDDRSTTRMPSREASKYCVRQGVTEAVLKAIPGAVKKIAADEEMVSVQKTIFEKARQTDIQAESAEDETVGRQPRPDPGNMIECMCCDGGCVGGWGNVVPSHISLPRVMKLKDEHPLVAQNEDVTAPESNNALNNATVFNIDFKAELKHAHLKTSIIALFDPFYHAEEYLLNSMDVSFRGDKTTILHSSCVRNRQNSPPKAKGDSIFLSDLHFDCGKEGISLSKISSSTLTLTTCSIVSNSQASPFVLFTTSGRDETSISLIDTTHKSSSPETLLPLGMFYQFAPLPSDHSPRGSTRPLHSIRCVSLSLSDCTLLHGTGPLMDFSSVPNSSGDFRTTEIGVETFLVAGSFRNVTSSPSQNVSCSSLFSQKIIGTSVTRSNNHLTGTTSLDMNCGGDLLCLNSSFSHCDASIAPSTGPTYALQHRSSSHSQYQFTSSTTASAIIFKRCSFHTMKEAYLGSAILHNNAPSSLSISECSFAHLRCSNNRGGAVSFTIQQLNIPSNSTARLTNSDGGGLDFIYVTNIVISNSVLQNCSAGWTGCGGGGLTCSYCGKLRMDSVQFRGCRGYEGKDVRSSDWSLSDLTPFVTNCDSTSGTPNWYLVGQGNDNSLVPQTTTTRTLQSIEPSLGADGVSATLLATVSGTVKGTMLVLVDNSDSDGQAADDADPAIQRLLSFPFPSPSTTSSLAVSFDDWTTPKLGQTYSVIGASINGADLSSTSLTLPMPSLPKLVGVVCQSGTALNHAWLRLVGKNVVPGTYDFHIVGLDDFVLSVSFDGSTDVETQNMISSPVSISLFGDGSKFSFNTQYEVHLVTKQGSSEPVFLEPSRLPFTTPDPPHLISAGEVRFTDDSKSTIEVDLVGVGLAAGECTVVVSPTSGTDVPLAVEWSDSSSGKATAILYSLTEGEVDLKYGQTYTITSLTNTSGVGVIFLTLTFSTPTEPTRLVTFTKGQYDSAMKKIGFVMTGRVLDKEATYKVELSASGAENHTIEMTYNSSNDKWKGSAVLYPSSEAELVYGKTYTVISFRKGSDSTELLRDAQEEIEIMAEPARLVSTSSAVNVGSNGTMLTLVSRSFSPNAGYSLKVVGTPTVPSGSNAEHTSTLTMTTTSATSSTLTASLYPLDSAKLLFGYTYSVDEMTNTDDSTPVLIEKTDCVFFTPTEPTRLITFTKGQYDDEKKKIGFVMTGRVLDKEATYKVELSASGAENHTIEMTYNSSNDKWKGSAVLYPSSEAELVYGKTYTVISFRKGSDSTELLRDAQEEIEIMAEPARLVSTSSAVNVGSNGTMLTLVSRSFSPNAGYSLKVVGTPTVRSGSNTEHISTLTMTTTSATSSTLTASLYPLDSAKLLFGYAYSVDEMTNTDDSTPVLIEKLDSEFSTPAEPERLVNVSSALSFSDPQQSKLLLTFSSRALLANTPYTITFQSTAVSSIPSHTKTITVTTENDGTIASFDHSLYPIEKGSKRGEQLEFGLTYTVVSFERGTTSLLFDTESHSFTVPTEPPRIEDWTNTVLTKDRSQAILSFTGRALRDGLGSVWLTNGSSFWESTSSLSVTDSTSCTATFAVGAGVSTSFVAFGGSYTVCIQTGETSSLVVNEDVTANIVHPPHIKSATPTVVNTPMTVVVVSFTGTDLEIGKTYQVTLNTSLTFTITMESTTNAMSSEMSLRSADSLQFGTEYEVDTITPLNTADGDVLFDKPLKFRVQAKPTSAQIFVDTETGTDTAFCGDKTSPCKTIDETWRIVSTFAFIEPSIFILESSSLSTQMEVTSSMHVLISSGWNIDPKLVVPSSASVADGTGLIVVTSGFLELRNVDVVVHNTSPAFVFLEGDNAKMELKDGLFTVEPLPTTSSQTNTDDICSWTTGLIRLNSCHVEITKTEFIRLPSGAIEMKGGVLTIRLSSFESNTPPSSPFPSIRRNIHCSEEGKIDIVGLTVGDGAKGSSAWMSTDDCSLSIDDVESNAPLFIPTLSPNSTSTFEKKKDVFNVVVLGTTLIPCGLSLEVFEMQKNDVKGKSIPIQLDPSSSASFTDSNITLSLNSSSFSSLNDKHEWRGRLNFGNDQRTETSFQFQASLSARRSQALKDSMKWWIPLVVVLVCVLILVIIVTLILWKRKQKKGLAQNIEEMNIQPVDDEKIVYEEFFENPANSALAISSSVQSKEESDTYITHLQQTQGATISNIVEVVVCENGFEMSTANEIDTLFSALHSKDSARELCKLTVQQQIARGLVSLAQVKPVVDIMTKLSSHWVFFDGQDRVCLKTRGGGPRSMEVGQQPQQNPQEAEMKKGNQEFQRWMAPELANQNSTQVSNQADHAAVFSLGLVLWEIETGLVPFAEVDEQTAQRRLRLGEKPKMETVSEEMQAIIESCLNLDPSKRPSLKTVSTLLDQMDGTQLPSDENRNKFASKTS
ncbi:Fe-hydrogenase, simple [Blattamonas nauphoetae]|uniref:Fe-hydrogenase, simple n=1 Tax=Blattamonas nauphoetae TaxID=2049346 RepID=A0ABQ9XBQ7_9EUKA|nr:Fe-hydrogenase, simple [Blattamonas nauphoetae]